MGKTTSVNGPVVGKVGAAIFYQLPGVDNLVVKGRQRIRSKYALKNHPRFKKTREQNLEFKGCVKTAREIATCISQIKILRDYNYSGDLLKICKMVQKADTVSEIGKRAIRLSAFGSYFAGFSFNKLNSLESLVQVALKYTTDREQGMFTVEIPELIPGIHLRNHSGETYYRFVAKMHTMDDCMLNERGDAYEFAVTGEDCSALAYTEWVNWRENFAARSMRLSLDGWTNTEKQVIISAFGIEFGRPVPGGAIEYVKYSGAGKIVAVN